MNNPKSYLNDYHQQRNEAVLQEVKDLYKHPTSLQAAIAQVQRLKQQSRSTEKKGAPSMKK